MTCSLRRFAPLRDLSVPHLVVQQAAKKGLSIFRKFAQCAPNALSLRPAAPRGEWRFYRHVVDGSRNREAGRANPAYNASTLCGGLAVRRYSKVPDFAAWEI